MQLTVLEIVQQVLSKTSSDEVNSISDTVESMQVAYEVMSTYYYLMSNIDFPDKNELVSFEPSLLTTRPTHMRVKTPADKFQWVYYNNGTEAAPNYKEVCYLPPKDFFEQSINSSQGSTTQIVEDPTGAFFTVKNDSHPKYYTLFDDEYVVFDSFLASTDDTLQESKVIAYATKLPSFTLDDSHIPDLPAKYFPWLLAEVTAACYFYNRQTQSPVDEERRRRQLTRFQNNIHRYDGNNTGKLKQDSVDFGRN